MDSVLKNNIYFQCAEKIFHDTSWTVWDRRPLKESDRNLYWQNGTPVPWAKATSRDSTAILWSKILNSKIRNTAISA